VSAPRLKNKNSSCGRENRDMSVACGFGATGAPLAPSADARDAGRAQAGKGRLRSLLKRLFGRRGPEAAALRGNVGQDRPVAPSAPPVPAPIQSVQPTAAGSVGVDAASDPQRRTPAKRRFRSGTAHGGGWRRELPMRLRAVAARNTRRSQRQTRRPLAKGAPRRVVWMECRSRNQARRAPLKPLCNVVPLAGLERPQRQPIKLTRKAA